MQTKTRAINSFILKNCEAATETRNNNIEYEWKILRWSSEIFCVFLNEYFSSRCSVFSPFYVNFIQVFHLGIGFIAYIYVWCIAYFLQFHRLNKWKMEKKQQISFIFFIIGFFCACFCYFTFEKLSRKLQF